MHYESQQFMFHRGDRLMTADVAELSEGGRKQWINRASRCITIKSHRTGATATFRLTHIQVDADQDICYWDFAAVDSDSRANLVTVRVFND